MAHAIGEVKSWLGPWDKSESTAGVGQHLGLNKSGDFLRRPSNFHATCFRTNWRRPGQLRGRGERGNVYLAVSRIPLVSRSVESKIQHAWIQLLAPDRNLRRCRNDCVFSPLSKRWSAFRRSSHFSGRRGDHGRRWDYVFSRNAVVAAPRRHYPRHRRFIFVTAIKCGSKR